MKPEVDVSMSTGVEAVAATEEHQRRALVEAARAIRDAAREAEVALLRAATEDGEPALGDVVQRLCDLHMTVARASVRIDRFENLKDALTIAVRELEAKREEV